MAAVGTLYFVIKMAFFESHCTKCRAIVISFGSREYHDRQLTKHVHYARLRKGRMNVTDFPSF